MKSYLQIFPPAFIENAALLSCFVSWFCKIWCQSNSLYLQIYCSFTPEALMVFFFILKSMEMYGYVGKGGMNWESSTDIYTLPSVKQVSSWKWLYRTRSSACCCVMTQRGGMGGVGREFQEEEDLCKHIANSLCYTKETDTFESNYTPIKK